MYQCDAIFTQVVLADLQSPTHAALDVDSATRSALDVYEAHSVSHFAIRHRLKMFALHMKHVLVLTALVLAVAFAPADATRYTRPGYKAATLKGTQSSSGSAEVATESPSPSPSTDALSGVAQAIESALSNATDVFPAST